MWIEENRLKLREEKADREGDVSSAVGPEGEGGGDPTLKSVTRKIIERQELYNGFGNGLALAFELALAPVIFGLMGYGLDRWLDTLPVFTIIGALLCVVGLGARQFYGYDAQMKVHEAAGPWARTADSAAAAVAVGADEEPAPPDHRAAGH